MLLAASGAVPPDQRLELRRLDRVSRALLEKETLEAAEFEALIRGAGTDTGKQHVA